MNRRIAVYFIVLTLILAVGTGYAAEEKKEPEAYSAVILNTQGPIAARSINVTIRIDELTTDQEVKEFAELLLEGGQDALRKKLEKVKVGIIAPSGRLGNDIAIARIHETDAGRRIRIFTARIMPFLELYISGRTTDYPFSFMEFTVDGDGKGQGSVIAAVQVKITEDGVLNMESYGLQPLKLVNIRRHD